MGNTIKQTPSNLRIALTGAGGTGKGTLGALVAKYLSVPFLPSHIKDTGVTMGMTGSYRAPVSKEHQLAFQYAILFGQIYQERACMIQNTGYVAERSTLDYIPYFTNRGFEESFTSSDDYEFIATDWAAHNYDGIIIVPYEFEAKDAQENSWRERDKEQQLRTDRILKELADGVASECGIPILTVTGSVEQRLLDVIKWLESIKSR